VLAPHNAVIMTQSPYETPQNARENLVVDIFMDPLRELLMYRSGMVLNRNHINHWLFRGGKAFREK
jgi:hypothetical protein